MALSSQQKADILFHLGWPIKTLDSTSTDYNKIIVDRLANISAEGEVITLRLLNRINKMDTALEDAICRLSAKRVGDIETNEYELESLRKEKLKLLRELSDLLDIPLDRQGSGGIKVCV